MTSAIDFEKFRTKPRPEKLSARFRRAKTAYVQLDLEELALACRAFNNYGTLVWGYIQYEAWRTKSPTVKVTNEAFKPYGGINRHAKYRAVKSLEKAGLLEIITSGKQSITVVLKSNMVHNRA